MNIAVIVPTIRKEQIEIFKKEWSTLFEKHHVQLYIVWDGDNPTVEVVGNKSIVVPNKDHLVPIHTSAVRMLGFLAAYQHEADIIMTFDDDVSPIGDPIQDHLDILHSRLPLSWISTSLINSSLDYPRGMPYAIREEAQVMLSHGVWKGIPDYDAPTQLHTSKELDFYRGPIPRGIFFPFCGMNVAFKREATPYMYWANSVDLPGGERFDDIWGGIEIKKDFDKLGWAVATGYSVVNHNRLSNVFNSLIHEAVGIGKNEKYWKGEEDDFYKSFLSKREQWKKLILCKKTS